MTLSVISNYNHFLHFFDIDMEEEEEEEVRSLSLLGILIQAIPPSRPYIPSLRLRVDLLKDADCVKLFRFSKDQIFILNENVLLPAVVITADRHRALNVEALCIFLRRMAYPSRYYDLIKIFSRSQTALSRFFNEVLDHIYKKFLHLLKFDSTRINQDKLALFAKAIKKKGSPLNNCVGFIDGTVRAICRPTKYQKEVYNGHKVFLPENTNQ